MTPCAGIRMSLVCLGLVATVPLSSQARPDVALRRDSGPTPPGAVAKATTDTGPRYEAKERAVLLGVGLGLNGLRPADTVAGQVIAGLRLPCLELQLALSYPSMALLGQLRINLVAGRRFWLVPFVTAGATVAYNNGTDLGPAAALVAGGGVRVGPWATDHPLWGRLYASVEVLASSVVSQATPPGRSQVEDLAVPVLLSLGTELWP